MKLNEILIRKSEIAQQMRDLKETYEKAFGKLKNEGEELSRLESIALNDVTLDFVVIAEKILYTQGNPSNNCEGQVLTDLAAYDIAKGCNHLKKEFYGNKTYSSYYQRCDCNYGFGPGHGGICEAVGLRQEYRDKVLTEDEKEACIYYLRNFKKIYEATKKQKVA